MYSIFSLLTLPEMNNREVILIAFNILESLAKQNLPESVHNEVFQHPNFKQFMAKFAMHSDVFLRSSVLDMIEVFCKEETYKKETSTLPDIRNFLREIACGMLSKTPAETTATFLIELLLIVTPAKDVGELAMSQQKKLNSSWRTSSAPSVLMRPKQGASHPLQDLTSTLMMFLEKYPLSVPSARAWCLAFRLLQIGGI